MATNKRLFLIFVVAPALAFVAFSIAWISSLSVGITSMEELSITDVQFDKDYLTITVKNSGSRATIISEVMVNQTSTPHTVAVHEPVSVGEEISIRIGFKWTSGYTYQIRLTATLDNYFHTAVAP